MHRRDKSDIREVRPPAERIIKTYHIAWINHSYFFERRCDTHRHGTEVDRHVVA